MKTMYKVLFSIIAFAILSLSLSAQEEDKKSVKIKKIVNIDGEETIIDTAFEIGSLQELEDLEDIHLMIGDEVLENLELSKEVELIMESLDSAAGKKIMMMNINSDGENVWLTDGVESAIMNCDEGEKQIIIKKSVSGDENDVTVLCSDDVNLDGMKGEYIAVKTTDDGKKITVKDKDGIEKEYHVTSDKGAFMIDDDGELTKLEGNHELMWVGEEGQMTIRIEKEEDGKTIVIRNNEDKTEEYILNEGDNKVFLQTSEDGNHGETDVYVNVVKTKDGDGAIVIKSKISIYTLEEIDEEMLQKSGVNVQAENKLEVNDLNFYPNPGNGKFSLKFDTPENGDLEIRIYDLNGKEVYYEKSNRHEGSYENTIDISNEQKGTYFLNIIQNGKSITKKIILE